MQRFCPHTHTEMSNFRLLDCINKLPNLIKRGKEIGLAGLAVTDHETIAQSIRICKLQKENPDFKITIGNEIYLTNVRHVYVAGKSFRTTFEGCANSIGK